MAMILTTSGETTLNFAELQSKYHLGVCSDVHLHEQGALVGVNAESDKRCCFLQLSSSGRSPYVLSKDLAREISL